MNEQIKKLQKLAGIAYNPEHQCLTPGAVYSTKINNDKVEVSVKLPFVLELSETESEELEAKLHYAVENVLSKYFGVKE